MVRIIDYKYQADPQGSAILEINVFPDARGNAVATLDIQAPKTSRRIGPSEYPDPMPPTEAFIRALGYAERAAIPYLCVRDPKGLFPPSLRPVRDLQASA